MSGAPDRRLTLTDMAKLAEVRLSAVSNWRKRYRDFPAPSLVSGQETFGEDELARWLGGRKIPRNRLKAGEALGTSYGDRFLVNSGVPRPGDTDKAKEFHPPKANWQSILRDVMDKLRGHHDTAASFEILLALVYVKACRPEIWQGVVGAPDWSTMHKRLSSVMLRANTDDAGLPLFGAFSQLSDPSLREVVLSVDRIDLGAGGGSESVAGQLGDAILEQLQRRMGRGGGHFTPADVSRCLAALLDPRISDRVYDPFCGSGELLIAAAENVASRTGSLTGWTVFGQPSHDWSWCTSAMNLELHGVGADLGTSGNALEHDRFPEARFSRILANPPFNLKLSSLPDRAWPFGEPSPARANFAWLQHVVTKLEPGGLAAVVMPGGAASSSGKDAGIRQAMVEAGVVDCVIALPPNLFRYTAVPTMVWLLSAIDGAEEHPETLFIDAGELGEVFDRTKRRLREEDIGKIVGEFWRWRGRPAGESFVGIEGFSRSIGRAELGENNHILVPARYTGMDSGQWSEERASAELDDRRNEIERLRQRAAQVRTVTEASLASLLAGRWPDGDSRPTSLGEVCDVLAGPGTVKRSGTNDSSWVPLVLPRNIRDHRVESTNLDVVPPETVERLSNYRLAAGDVISARAGTLGRYGLVLESQAGWLLGPGCVRFRPNEQVDPYFLTYYLGSPNARRWLDERASGSAIKHVTSSTLRSMPVPLPPISTQRAIVDILGPLATEAFLHEQLSAATSRLHETLVEMLMSSAK